MKKIILTEDQLNRLVEMKHKNVFKDEHKMKDAVESHLSEEKEVCGCGCEKGKCDCGPECAKCDCGKKKEAKEDWDPIGSVGVSGVAQDVARKGMNTLWETELSYGSDHDNPYDDYHSEKEQYRVSEVLYEIGKLLFSIGRHEESEKYRQSAINNAPDWGESELPPYGDTPKYEIPGMKDSMNDLDDLVNSVKRKEVNESILNNFKRFL